MWAATAFVNTALTISRPGEPPAGPGCGRGACASGVCLWPVRPPAAAAVRLCAYTRVRAGPACRS
eukprot:scaffold30091_cov101-Isochrysis_galbana.AAC.2